MKYLLNSKDIDSIMDRPINYVEEKERCKAFLRGYNDDLSGHKKYDNLIRKLAARDEKVMLVELDDLLAVSEVMP